MRTGTIIWGIPVETTCTGSPVSVIASGGRPNPAASSPTSSSTAWKLGSILGHHHALHPAADHVQVGRQHAHPQLEAHLRDRLAKIHASQVRQDPVGADHRMTGERTARWWA